jgi:hypothetical protein
MFDAWCFFGAWDLELPARFLGALRQPRDDSAFMTFNVVIP